VGACLNAYAHHSGPGRACHAPSTVQPVPVSIPNLRSSGPDWTWGPCQSRTCTARERHMHPMSAQRECTQALTYAAAGQACDAGATPSFGALGGGTEPHAHDVGATRGGEARVHAALPEPRHSVQAVPWRKPVLLQGPRLSPSTHTHGTWRAFKLGVWRRRGHYSHTAGRLQPQKWPAPSHLGKLTKSAARRSWCAVAGPRSP
jgi:hypothetical protein